MVRNGLVSGVLLWVCSAVAPAQAQTALQPGQSVGQSLESVRFFSAPLNEDGSAIEIPGPISTGSGATSRADSDVPTNPVGAAAPELSAAEIERLKAAIDRRLAAIAEETSRNGERSPALIDELSVLADLYRQRGDNLFAATALDDAVQLYRMNYGLYSLGQFDIVRQLIDSQVAMGEFTEAAFWQNYMLDLTWRNRGDPRVPEILTTIADEQLDRAAFELERGAQPVVSINVSVGFGQATGTQSPPTGPAMARSLVHRARLNYRQATWLTANSEANQLPELYELQSKLLDTYYFELAQVHLDGDVAWNAGGACYGCGGRQLLDAKVKNSVAFEDPVAVALSLIELGDWNLMFSMNGEALADYQTAYDYMQMQHVAPETISAILSPATPVRLPAFGPFTNRYDPARAYDGFFDVRIKISRYGETKDVDVVSGSSRASKQIEQRLRKSIGWTNFRPRFVDGEPVRSDRFLMRYYYVY